MKWGLDFLRKKAKRPMRFDWAVKQLWQDVYHIFDDIWLFWYIIKFTVSHKNLLAIGMPCIQLFGTCMQLCCIYIHLYSILKILVCGAEVTLASFRTIKTIWFQTASGPLIWSTNIIQQIWLLHIGSHNLKCFFSLLLNF
jgi:hypothetical protein